MSVPTGSSCLRRGTHQVQRENIAAGEPAPITLSLPVVFGEHVCFQTNRRPERMRVSVAGIAMGMAVFVAMMVVMFVMMIFVAGVGLAIVGGTDRERQAALQVDELGFG